MSKADEKSKAESWIELFGGLGIVHNVGMQSQSCSFGHVHASSSHGSAGSPLSPQLWTFDCTSIRNDSLDSQGNSGKLSLSGNSIGEMAACWRRPPSTHLKASLPVHSSSHARLYEWWTLQQWKNGNKVDFRQLKKSWCAQWPLPRDFAFLSFPLPLSSLYKCWITPEHNFFYGGTAISPFCAELLVTVKDGPIRWRGPSNERLSWKMFLSTNKWMSCFRVGMSLPEARSQRSKVGWGQVGGKSCDGTWRKVGKTC